MAASGPAARALARSPEYCRDLTFGGSVMSVRPRGVTKWCGVVAYCERERLDPGRVLAIGDGENDLELLRAAFARAGEALAAAGSVQAAVGGEGWPEGAVMRSKTSASGLSTAIRPFWGTLRRPLRKVGQHVVATTQRVQGDWEGR
jgi:hypothetical protein